MHRSSSRERRAAGAADLRILAALAFLPIVLFAARAGLWAPDEPRYAEVAREAWQRSDPLVMHLNGRVYPDKPPLLYWLAGAAGSLGGWSELALRLPSLLATLGTAWLCARLARRWWGEREAAYAPLFWLGTVMVLYLGGRLQIDPLLTFFCLASIELATAEPTPRPWAAGLCAGLAGLAKGPVAWMHVVLALLAWRLVARGARRGPAIPVRGWIAFAALAVAPVLLWALAATAREPSLGRALFFGQHVGRALEGTSHAAPPWHYLVDMPFQLLPWTPLLLAAFVRAFREWRSARGGRQADAGLLRAASWFLLLFVVFSVIPSKRALYLLPICPAAALLLAREAASAESSAVLPRWVRLGTAVPLLVLGAALAAIRWIPTHLVPPGLLEGFSEVRDELALVGAPLLLAGLLATLPRLPPRAWIAAVGSGFAIAWTIYAARVVPEVDPLKSTRRLALWIADRPEKPQRIAFVGERPEGYRFYGGIPGEPEELLHALAREGPRFLGVIARKHWERQDETVRRRFVILREQYVGTDDVLVVGSAVAAAQNTPPGAASR